MSGYRIPGGYKEIPHRGSIWEARKGGRRVKVLAWAEKDNELFALVQPIFTRGMQHKRRGLIRLATLRKDYRKIGQEIGRTGYECSACRDSGIVLCEGYEVRCASCEKGRNMPPTEDEKKYPPLSTSTNNVNTVVVPPPCERCGGSTAEYTVKGVRYRECEHCGEGGIVKVLGRSYVRETMCNGEGHHEAGQPPEIILASVREGPRWWCPQCGEEWEPRSVVHHEAKEGS